MIAEKGRKVKIHYHGKTLDDKYVLSTMGKDPVDFTLGRGVAPSGLEENIIGMRVGEKKEITLNPADGFGKKNRTLVTEINKGDFSDNADPQIGQAYKVKFPDGSIKKAKVMAVEDNTVTLDANHPLAGRTVKLKVEVVAVG